MSSKLIQLPPAQKKAVVALACMVEASENDGFFNTYDPGVRLIVRECFDGNWPGNWDHDFLAHYLSDAVTLDMESCARIVSTLDMETRYAFKNFLIDIMGDSAIKMLTVSEILQEVQSPGSKPSWPGDDVLDDFDEFDDYDDSDDNDDSDDDYDAKKNNSLNESGSRHFARLKDLRAIRVDASKSFSFTDSRDNSKKEVRLVFCNI